MYIAILSGQVTLKAGGYLKEATTFDVPAFEIGKYPVTNNEYRRFVEDNGYNNLKYWDETGWEIKKVKSWSQPRYWDDFKFNQENHPIVGVSFYEAIAYCNWLSEKTGDNITLPTEQQWQRAAQAMPDGSDGGYLYPWGNEWDNSKCNNSVEKEGVGTTPVDYYEQAGNVSPCGVVGTSGNVWEWYLTEYYTGKNRTYDNEIRVLRGGSWAGTYAVYLRSATRYWFVPNGRYDGIGFRCVRL